MLDTLLLLKNKKEYFYTFLILFIIFLSNLFLLHINFNNFKSEELYFTNAKVIQVYKKEKFNIYKLSNKEITFFTSSNKDIKKLSNINITILTKNITFYDYLKGFYTPSFNLYKIFNTNSSYKTKISNFINNQHSNSNISEIFNALFLAIPFNKDLQQIISNYGISHLIAISGFHLGIITFIFYWIIYFLYTNIHQKYFPYRNKKLDILIIVSIILFAYLYFLQNVPSLLRSYVMYIFALFLLINNIKLVSFSTLLLISLFIISLFPKLLFSLSLWFSIAGVFYIFLFIKYFSKNNKYLLFIFFNVWIFLAINPITHYFFPNTTLMQLFSPLLTLSFTIFYPLELFLHLIKEGDLLDNYINIFLSNNTNSIKEFYTPVSLFITYIILSLLSIKYKLVFILLNIFLISFNLFIFLK